MDIFFCLFHEDRSKEMEMAYWDTYSRVQKSIEIFVFRPIMAIFRRAGMREGGLPPPLAFQYLILMI